MGPKKRASPQFGANRPWGWLAAPGRNDFVRHMFDPNRGSPNGVDGLSVLFDGHTMIGMMSDIRFVLLCAKLGLCDYWAKTGRWPDCAETIAPYYDFKAEAQSWLRDRI
jgi:hypothetical protein